MCPCALLTGTRSRARANQECQGECDRHSWRIQLTDGPDGTVIVLATLQLAAPAVFVCRVTGFAWSADHVDRLDLFGTLGFSVVARELPDAQFALTAFDRLREQLADLVAGRQPAPRCASERDGFRWPRR